MLKSDFDAQMARLKTRFGEKAFDAAFVHLIWLEVQRLTPESFQRMVDQMIGLRPQTKPPLLSDFKAARANTDTREHKRDDRPWGRPLPEVLAKTFGAVKNVREALEIARLRRSIQRSSSEGGGRVGADKQVRGAKVEGDGLETRSQGPRNPKGPRS